MDQQRDLPLAQQLGHFLRAIGRVGGNADIQRFAALHGVGQRRGRLFHRRVFIHAVGVENIHVVDAQTLQALVEAGEQILTRTA